MRPVLVLLLLLPLAASQPAATEADWFLTGQTGDLPEQGLTGVQFMGPDLANTNSEARFSSAPSDPITGGPTVKSVSWVWNGVWSMDTEILSDPSVVLYLRASVQVDVTVQARLEAVDADGSTLVAQAERRVGVGDSTDDEVRLSLPARGESVPAGSTLRLVIRVEGNSLATVLQYDSSQTPSRIEALRTRPLDRDEDGLPDSLERAAGTDPLDANDPGDAAYDSDGDGLPDALEAIAGTDPLRRDSDGDGWGDGAEYHLGTDPTDSNDAPRDTDGDGLADAFESRSVTDRTRADSDGDGISDCNEDDDGDGLTHCVEQDHGTDPLSADTDGDGKSDADEIAAGTDPLLHAAPPQPPRPQAIEVVAAAVMLTGIGALALVGLFGRHRL